MTNPATPADSTPADSTPAEPAITQTGPSAATSSAGTPSAWTKAILTVSSLIYLLVLPLLEISPTHVFNPDWPGHARLHEVWQLTANGALALTCLWLVWFRAQALPALGLALIVNLSFIFAVAIAGTYEGTMKHSDGTELALAGVNVAVLVIVVVTAFLILAFVRERAKSN